MGCRYGIWRRNQSSMSEWLAAGSGGFRPALPLIAFGMACPPPSSVGLSASRTTTIMSAHDPHGRVPRPSPTPGPASRPADAPSDRATRRETRSESVRRSVCTSMKLTVQTFLTLDGVMQAPGGPEEDPSDAFTHGGWQAPFPDAAVGEFVTELNSHASSFLFGRRT